MKKSFKIVLLMIIMLALGTIVSNATITVNSQTVNSGEQVTISVNSNQALGAYKVSVTDNGGLTFVTSTGQEGAGKTVISGSSTSGVTNLATFTFKTPSVTENKTYNVVISATGMETPNLEAVSDSSATATITVKAPNSNTNEGNNKNIDTPAKKSSNANLANLIVSPVDFTGFRANKTSGYKVTVDNNVTEVKITAKVQDAKSKVTVTGDKNLKVGSNTVEVLVTAEDGTKKTYKVEVVRKELEEVAPVSENETTAETSTEPVTEEPKQEENKLAIVLLKLLGITENGITIEPRLSPEFDRNTYIYTTIVTSDVDKIKVGTVTSEEGATVEVKGNEGLKAGENTIMIMVKSADGQRQQPYKITVNKTGESLDLTHNTELTKKLIICAIIAILTLAIIVAIIIRARKGNKKRAQMVSMVGHKNEEYEDENEYEEIQENEDDENRSTRRNSINGTKTGKRFK